MNGTDEQLWNYIDGNCTPQERETIERLLAIDSDLREKLIQLQEFNSEITAMELEEPPMAFTYNVMEGIRNDYARQPLKTAISPTIIKLLGGFFAITLLAMFVFIFANISWTSSGNVVSDINNHVPQLSAPLSKGVFKYFMYADIVVGLFLFNEFLHRRGAAKHL